MFSPNDIRRRLVDRFGVSFLPKRLRAFRKIEWKSFPVTLLVKLSGEKHQGNSRVATKKVRLKMFDANLRKS